jgi:hypothetical protein
VTYGQDRSEGTWCRKYAKSHFQNPERICLRTIGAGEHAKLWGDDASTVGEHVCSVAQRMENELSDEQVSFIEGCQRDYNPLPQPDGPLTVGIDTSPPYWCW